MAEKKIKSAMRVLQEQEALYMRARQLAQTIKTVTGASNKDSGEMERQLVEFAEEIKRQAIEP